MTKVAEARVTFTKHPSAAAGHEVVATVEAAAKFTSEGASGELMGQVTPAIAATEAQYGEMWAQDAAAMYRYAGPSTAKSTAELVAVDDYVTRTCPSSAKVFRALKALEKKKGTTNR